jgi:hypothetical protein
MYNAGPWLYNGPGTSNPQAGAAPGRPSEIQPVTQSRSHNPSQEGVTSFDSAGEPPSSLFSPRSVTISHPGGLSDEWGHFKSVANRLAQHQAAGNKGPSAPQQGRASSVPMMRPPSGRQQGPEQPQQLHYPGTGTTVGGGGDSNWRGDPYSRSRSVSAPAPSRSGRLATAARSVAAARRLERLASAQQEGGERRRSREPSPQGPKSLAAQRRAERSAQSMMAASPSGGPAPARSLAAQRRAESMQERAGAARQAAAAAAGRGEGGTGAGEFRSVAARRRAESATSPPEPRSRAAAWRAASVSAGGATSPRSYAAGRRQEQSQSAGLEGVAAAQAAGKSWAAQARAARAAEPPGAARGLSYAAERRRESREALLGAGGLLAGVSAAHSWAAQARASRAQSAAAGNGAGGARSYAAERRRETSRSAASLSAGAAAAPARSWAAARRQGGSIDAGRAVSAPHVRGSQERGVLSAAPSQRSRTPQPQTSGRWVDPGGGSHEHPPQPEQQHYSGRGGQHQSEERDINIGDHYNVGWASGGLQRASMPAMDLQGAHVGGSMPRGQLPRFISLPHGQKRQKGAVHRMRIEETDEEGADSPLESLRRADAAAAALPLPTGDYGGSQRIGGAAADGIVPAALTGMPKVGGRSLRRSDARDPSDLLPNPAWRPQPLTAIEAPPMMPDPSPKRSPSKRSPSIRRVGYTDEYDDARQRGSRQGLVPEGPLARGLSRRSRGAVTLPGGEQSRNPRVAGSTGALGPIRTKPSSGDTSNDTPSPHPQSRPGSAGERGPSDPFASAAVQMAMAANIGDLGLAPSSPLRGAGAAGAAMTTDDSERGGRGGRGGPAGQSPPRAPRSPAAKPTAGASGKHRRGRSAAAGADGLLGLPTPEGVAAALAQQGGNFPGWAGLRGSIDQGMAAVRRGAAARVTPPAQVVTLSVDDARASHSFSPLRGVSARDVIAGVSPYSAAPPFSVPEYLVTDGKRPVPALSSPAQDVRSSAALIQIAAAASAAAALPPPGSQPYMIPLTQLPRSVLLCFYLSGCLSLLCSACTMTMEVDMQHASEIQHTVLCRL